MYTHNLLWIHCLSPLHNGAGQGMGSIDRPIIREVHTGYPFIQSSTLKGAISAAKRPDQEKQRSEWSASDKKFYAAFGAGETDGNQGCITFSEAHVLFFPVRSLAGTFAWVTCPNVLMRFSRYLKMANPADMDMNILKQAVELTIDEEMAVGSSDRIRINNRYCIENLVLEHDKSKCTAWESFSGHIAGQLFPDDEAEKQFFSDRLLLVNDDNYAYLLRHCTAVEANIQVLPSGVTKEGSLRYTEYLPMETILVSLVSIAAPLHKDSGVSKEAAEELLGKCMKVDSSGKGILQFGADESKGKGLVRVRYQPDQPTSQTGEGGTEQ